MNPHQSGGFMYHPREYIGQEEIIDEVSTAKYKAEYIKLLFSVCQNDDEMLARLREIDPETMNHLMPEAGQKMTEPAKGVDRYDVRAGAILDEPSVYYKVVHYVVDREVKAGMERERRLGL
jgi:hypothetical protein